MLPEKARLNRKEQKELKRKSDLFGQVGNHLIQLIAYMPFRLRPSNSSYLRDELRGGLGVNVGRSLVRGRDLHSRLGGENVRCMELLIGV